MSIHVVGGRRASGRAELLAGAVCAVVTGFLLMGTGCGNGSNPSASDRGGGTGNELTLPNGYAWIEADSGCYLSADTFYIVRSSDGGNTWTSEVFGTYTLNKDEHEITVTTVNRPAQITATGSYAVTYGKDTTVRVEFDNPLAPAINGKKTYIGIPTTGGAVVPPAGNLVNGANQAWVDDSNDNRRGFILKSDRAYTAIAYDAANERWDSTGAGTWSVTGNTLLLTGGGDYIGSGAYTVSSNILSWRDGTFTKTGGVAVGGGGGCNPSEVHNLPNSNGEAWVDNNGNGSNGFILRSDGTYTAIGKDGRGYWTSTGEGTWSDVTTELLDNCGYTYTLTLTGTGPYAGSFDYVVLEDGKLLWHSAAFTETGVVMDVTPLTADAWTYGEITPNNQSNVMLYSFNVTMGVQYYVSWDDRFSGPRTGTADIDGIVTYSDGWQIFNLDNSDTPRPFTAIINGTVIIRVYPTTTGTFGVMYARNPR